VAIVGCKLPRGFTIEVGIPATKSYQWFDLNGLNKAKRGVKYGVTDIPDAVWITWLTKNKTLRYVVDKSIFVVSG
jgi:hypothetical protein